MFNAALFTTAKIWKQPNEENVLHRYNEITAIKENENLPLATWMDLVGIMLSEIVQIAISLICGIYKTRTNVTETVIDTENTTCQRGGVCVGMGEIDEEQ